MQARGFRIVAPLQGPSRNPNLEKPPETQGKRLHFEKNDGSKEWARNQPLESWVISLVEAMLQRNHLQESLQENKAQTLVSWRSFWRCFFLEFSKWSRKWNQGRKPAVVLLWFTCDPYPFGWAPDFEKHPV